MTKVYCPDCGSEHEIPDAQADAAKIKSGDTVICNNCTGGLSEVVETMLS